MALNTKAIKRRIKSITSTRKITKAMEMISAVKMRRAVLNALATRNYAVQAWEIINDIAKRTDIKLHPLLMHRPIKKIGLIFITSNRGLAGGFTSRLIAAAQEYVKSANLETNAEIDLILMGKQGKKAIYRLNKKVVAQFEKIDLTTKLEEVIPLSQLAIQDYINGTYDRVVVAYTHFSSALQQVPRLKQILPLEKGLNQMLDIIEESITETDLETSNVGESEKQFSEAWGDEEGLSTYRFEPKTSLVLNNLLPRLVEMQVYQAILESDASEHSARMLAMRNASDAAKDMIKELNYIFNKARQAAITQEISEIVGGAAALA
ncbi:MAG: ATP synthase F1 subunit gamma [Candidatus Magasanikbacteria bacterium RIFCSPHIGHO2_02_FULL_45_10]|uniref:ATP synthase gamma chain n=1 Tax=Candidatus Magasanikbacteria bacterium RIFCSPHIGHO2_02_FULL_45_10 TaxID=1798679 RepID=A0A1F6MAN2_9BACT|nr:MAG: ATP synthase F1 subunit gamma [Candidatus Magasanikbacteria bacterium RIFCSPHIGHO2_02_FULL_45_10]